MSFFFERSVNCLLKRFYLAHISGTPGVVYLTFDDGPEPGITEFVLDELGKYGYHGTFFCTGRRAEEYPDLIARIYSAGHSIGNHSYSHIPAYEMSGKDYVSDVLRADQVLNAPLFRPPNGCLTFPGWFRLRKKFKIVYWTIGSGDWLKENLNYEEAMERLSKTASGDILLFHFSNDLQLGTRKLLPPYLAWLKGNGFTSEKLV